MKSSRATVDLYLRLSVDRDGKDSLERQEAELRAWAGREGLTVRKVWADAGRSGYKADVVRADFEAALAAVSSGEVGTLAVWKLDRLSRRGAGEVGRVLDQVEAAGGRVFFLRDSLDSTVPGHRMVIVMVSEQARAESANTSLRVRAKIASDAAAGVPKRGVRPFGWEADGVTVRESEAVLIREAVRSVLDGGSMTRIARDWTDAGVLTDGMSRTRKVRTPRDAVDTGERRPARQAWTTTTVRQLLLRDRNAGVLVTQRDPKTRQGGEEQGTSLIQPIITRDELDALKSRVKAGTPVASRAVSLLGGVLRCECGEPMHSSVSYSQRKGGPRHVYRAYKCSASMVDRTRSHASMQEHKADALAITAATSALIDRRHADPAPNLATTLRVRRAELEAERTDATDDLSIPGVDKARVRKRLAQIDSDARMVADELDRLAAADAGASVIAMANALVAKFAVADFEADGHGGADRDALNALWAPLREEIAAMPTDDLRALVRAIVRIVIHPRGTAERYTVTYPETGELVPLLT